jgi:hypothetical protein
MSPFLGGVHVLGAFDPDYLVDVLQGDHQPAQEMGISSALRNRIETSGSHFALLHETGDDVLQPQ